MSSAKRKPRTPSPLEDEEALDKTLQDLYAGRRVSVTEFDTKEVLDYDSVASPGASSTSSEPSYVRQPGFDHHAHQVPQNSSLKPKHSQSKRTKKKRNNGEDTGEITITSIPVSSSIRQKEKKGEDTGF